MQDNPAAGAPCRVRKVFIRGLKHTRESVIRSELARVERASTLGEISNGCLEAAGALQSLGIFEGCDVLVDSAPMTTIGASGPLADIIVTVNEKKRLTSAATGVSTQGGENSMDANVSVRNAFGWAERLDLNMELGQQKSSTFKLGATRPRFLGTDAELAAEVSKNGTTHIKHSSFFEKLLGGSLSCRLGSAHSERGMHTFAYALESRDICKLPPSTASWAILQQRGLSLKSSLSHTFALSRLDNPVVPSAGGAVKLQTELAGVLPAPLGDVRFVKQTLTAAAYAPLLTDGRLTFGVQLTAGLLMPFESVLSAPLGVAAGTPAAAHGPPESCISDRFFLGGPGSFWGFRTRGCGPRELRNSKLGDAEGQLGAKAPRDALGGDVMAVGTASLSAALPGKKLEEMHARAHVFASAGGLTGLAALNAAGSFAPSLRTCVGIGLAVPTSVGRLELNLMQVLRRRPEDAVVRNGIQFGISPNLF